jgi:Histidine kinase-, DNA gyrase B-, and HSP90-like ATPase
VATARGLPECRRGRRRRRWRARLPLQVNAQIPKDVPILQIAPTPHRAGAGQHSRQRGQMFAARWSHRDRGRAGQRAGGGGGKQRDPGIPPEARATVFDVFHRVRPGDRQAAGIGLGLSICRGLIEAHGGRIEALPGQSRRGTTIDFWLPLHSGPASPIEYAPDIPGRRRRQTGTRVLRPGARRSRSRPGRNGEGRERHRRRYL